VEIGDVTLYTLFYYLRKSGLGKKHIVYMLFERGGGDDPFKQSVYALKLIAKYVEQEIPPGKLPPEFFGIEFTAGDIRRQMQIMMDHRFEPLKDLLETPEEQWGLLSQSAVKKGKTKEWAKEELR
jgi:hypothetical protein